MTLEEAQEKILELTEENQNLKTERDSLSQEKETLTKDNESLRTLNQKYFNKLIAQEADTTGQTSKDDEEGEKVPTWDEIAEKLNF